MRKILSAALAAMMALSLGVGASAASTTTIDLMKVSGQPIMDDGKQVLPAQTTATPSDSIAPNQSIYFALPPSVASWLSNSSNFRMTSKKVTNSKLIKSIKLVEKRLSGANLNVYIPNKANAAANISADFYNMNPANRQTYIEVALNDTTSEDEFKVAFSVTFSAKKAGTLTYAPKGDGTTEPLANLAIGDQLTLNGTFFVANKLVTSGDANISVGEKGMTVKPIGNEDNEITFESNDTLATLYFRATNNPSKFYAKLSTKWSSALLAKFSDTNAVIRAFSTANIDCTSRATLALNNPFSSDDVDPSDVYIYAVSSKGVLSDATKNFTYNDDDDTFECLTRSLGTWIISDQKISLK